METSTSSHHIKEVSRSFKDEPSSCLDIIQSGGQNDGIDLNQAIKSERGCPSRLGNVVLERRYPPHRVRLDEVLIIIDNGGVRWLTGPVRRGIRRAPCDVDVDPRERRYRALVGPQNCPVLARGPAYEVKVADAVGDGSTVRRDLTGAFDIAGDDRVDAK